MLVLFDLFVFEVIVTPELGVASSHGVGGFQQIIAKETVAGPNEPGVLSFKGTGLVLRPGKAGIFSNGRMGMKTIDIADLSDHAGGVDFADAGDRSKRVGNDFELLFNGFV